MLMAEPTKSGTGITIMGDTFDLRALYETIHFLSESSCFNPSQEEYLLAFAYEVRKARDNYRKDYKLRVDGETTLTYQGFNMIWTEILFTVSQLRHSASFQLTLSNHQAVLYQLESIIESALISYDKKVGLEVFQRFKAVPTVSSSFLTVYINDLSFDYTHKMGCGKKRFKLLPSLLDKMNWFSKDYQEFHSKMVTMRDGKVPPDELFEYQEWKEIKW